MIISAMSSSPGSSPIVGALPLSDWGVIRARGSDARSFLQGQLTQDVLTLRPDEARLAGYCSPKGRLIASFVVWAEGDDELRLACSAELLAPTRDRLARFVLRSRCQLTDTGGEAMLWGIAGAVSPAWGAPPAPWEVRRAGDGRLISLPPARIDGVDVPRALWAAPKEAEPPSPPALDPQAWAALEAASGVVRITRATTEQFVPQMVNFEIVGGVDFRKGCYPGQEVVARSQYRGTLKRRAALFGCSEPASSGQEVFHSDDPAQPAGMVALAGTLPPGRHIVLAEVKIAALAGGELRLGSAAGVPLERAELPYAVAFDGD